MQNIYENIKSGLQFNKFELDELLFVQYTCPIPDEESGIWTQTDYIIHVLSGEKTWRTVDGMIKVKAGDTVYIKKGGVFIQQFFNDDFCMLAFFVTDHFIKNTLQDLKREIPITNEPSNDDFILIPIQETPLLTSYFQSTLHYFSGQDKPLNTILELKFKELLISLITHENNKQLTSYITNLANVDRPSLSYIMEHNYYYNLSMEEMAKLCHRSLSSFKRDFKKIYNTSPGKWLLSKRLEHAAILLHDPALNVSRVAYESGFEDTSHFSRAFKEKFGYSPMHYRKQVLK